MIEVTPIRSEHVAAAKRMIATVAHTIFGQEQTLESFVDMIEHDGELDDVEDYQQAYVENRGLFLVALDVDKVIGTAGICRLHDDVAELKRIWLLEEYQGQQIGFRMVSMLLEFARRQGYSFAYLETTQLNKRAIGFYQKIGFYEIPSPYVDVNEVSMEMPLALNNDLWSV